MLDITQLNSFDINSPQALSEIKEKINDIVLHYESKEARVLYNFISSKLVGNKNIYLEQEYSKILSQLRFFDLDILSDNEIVGLYQNDFGKILEYFEDYDPFSVLRLKLLNIPLRDRDELKKRVVLALLNNKEIITTYAMFFVEGGKSEPPSIANWIKDYTMIAGGGIFTNMAKSNYFIKSQNYLALSNEEKQKVKVLLNFYFRLHLSSLTPQGLENNLVFIDKDGTTKILSEGKVIDTGKDATANTIPVRKRDSKARREKKIDNEVSEVATEAEKELINILEEEINQDAGGNFERLIESLKQSVDVGSQEEIEATLRILRKQGKIDEARKDLELLNDLKDLGFLNESGADEGGDLVVLKSEGVLKTGEKDVKQLMQEALIGDRLKEKEIKKLESEIKNSEGDDVEKIIGGLIKSPQPLEPSPSLSAGGGTKKTLPLIPPAGGGTIEEAVARLRLLARTDPNSLVKLLEPNAEQLTPSNFSELIKNVLGKKFGISNEETARYGMQLAIILKKQNMPEFMKTVYFDKKDGVFRWNDD